MLFIYRSMLYLNTSKTVKINNKSYVVYKRQDSRKFYVKHNNKYEVYSELKKKLENKKKSGGVGGTIHPSNINIPGTNLKRCTRDCEIDPTKYGCNKQNIRNCNKFSCTNACLNQPKTPFISGLQM